MLHDSAANGAGVLSREGVITSYSIHYTKLYDFDQLRVANLFTGTLHAEIVENGQQHRSNDQGRGGPPDRGDHFGIVLSQAACNPGKS